MALPNRYPRFQGPRPADLKGPYRGVNIAPQHVTGYREGFNKTPTKVLDSLLAGPTQPAHGDVQQVTQIRDQQADAGNALGLFTANQVLNAWNAPQPMLGGQTQAPRQQMQPQVTQPSPIDAQQPPMTSQRANPPGTHYGDWMLRQRQVAAGGAGVQQPYSPQPGGLQSLVNQVQDVATTPIGGGPRIPLAQPQQYATPQPLPSNQRYPLPMQMPDGGARAMADAINSGSPVPMQSGADPAVWGPGGRQYPTAVAPAASPQQQFNPAVAPRYGQSPEMARMSLDNAMQQARDFTNRGVDRIFASGGVEPKAGELTDMPYGSNSRLIRTADGRTILAGNASAGGLLETARANGGSIPQGSFNKSMQIAMDSSAKNPANMKRRAEVADQRAAERDRQIVGNAMRFGIRNPLAIQTAQRMGIRLPGMPRMSGDATGGGGGVMTTQAKIDTLKNAQNNPVYSDVEAGFDPGAANGDKWARHIANPNWEKIPQADVPRVQRELKAAMDMTNFKASDDDRELLKAFVSGGPSAVARLKKKRAAGYKPAEPATGAELMY